ncbi:MAG: nitroreductase family deazaflavin-dependent oxidoreductase [Deltaproteobacteria bacterium]|nr:nitroreductase family deazaflavin-dependent oxidoreductase [Deltaproteobacteria bacterium]
MSAPPFARRKTVRLTTRGRKSGQPRTVTIWFVADGERAILVQHTTAAAAQWYRNLLADPAVTLDFGDGPLSARATPIADPAAVQAVLQRVRRKYWTAWLIRLLARGATPVAARIAW